MKAYLLTCACCGIFSTLAFSQIRPSKEAEASAARIRDQIAEHKKHAEVGTKLFGEFSGGEDFSGTLASKNPTEYAVDDWGMCFFSLKTISKVSKTEYLVLPKYRNAKTMLIRGLDTAKLTDGVEFVFPLPVIISGTYSYETVGGANATVLVMEHDTKKVEKLVAAVKEKKVAAEAAHYREWREGKKEFLGKYIEYKNPVVCIKPKGSDDVKEIMLVDLSTKDQAWVIAELKAKSENKRLPELDRLRFGVLYTSAVAEQAIQKAGLTDAEKEMVYVYVNRDLGKRIPSAGTAKFVTFTKTEEVKAWVAAEKKYLAERDKGKAKPKPKGK